MFYDITLWILISFILIILIHYLFIFFKDTLTVPKVKDLIYEPLEKYKKIDNITNNINIEEGTTNINDLIKSSNSNSVINTDTNTDINTDINTDTNINDMKNELKGFFNDLKLQNNSSNIQYDNLDKKLYSEIR